MPVYRYKLSGVGLSDLSQKVPGSPALGNIGPSTYVDVTVASGSKTDLDDYMATKGYTYDSTDPVPTPKDAAVAAIATVTPTASAIPIADGTGKLAAGWMPAGSGLTKATHDALRSLIHFIEDGPAEQFASAAYCETLPVGDPFPTSCIWYTSVAKTSKIVEETVTWNTNKTINTDIWKMYDTDGSTVLVTVTDTFDYTGGNFLTPKRTRTIA